ISSTCACIGSMVTTTSTATSTVATAATTIKTIISTSTSTITSTVLMRATSIVGTSTSTSTSTVLMWATSTAATTTTISWPRSAPARGRPSTSLDFSGVTRKVGRPSVPSPNTSGGVPPSVWRRIGPRRGERFTTVPSSSI
ncbi:MAG: hypothetical protein B7Y02_17240, partial [Rhodobacterales bacterium 17-64-5]